MIRVLHVLTSMNRGGTETFIMNLYRKINRERVQFDFLLHNDEESDYSKEILKLGGKIYNVRPRNEGIVKNKKDLRSFFEAYGHEYKVIHQHISSLSYVTPLKIAKEIGIPLRITHGHSTKEGGSKLHNLLHGKNKIIINDLATHLFSCSIQTSKWLYGEKNTIKSKHKIINNGINLRKFQFDENERKKIIQKMNIETKYVIGLVANLIPVKNHSFLIEVFDKLVQKENDVTLLLIGEGPLRNDIEKLIDKKQLSKKVFLTGKRTDIEQLLNVIDVFVMPSYYEGFPVTLVEAQAMGIPCLISDTISEEVVITELVERISLNKSPNQWASKIQQILHTINSRNDSHLEIKEKGFDIDDIANHLENIYLSAGGILENERDI